MSDTTHKFRVGDDVIVVERIGNQEAARTCRVSRVAGQDVSVRLNGKHYYTFRGPNRSCVGHKYGYAPELRSLEEHATIPLAARARALARTMGDWSFRVPLSRAAAFLEALVRAQAIAEGKVQP